MKLRRIPLVLLVIVAACGTPGASPTQVVATTSILGDVVSNALGSPVDVLIPRGAEPHDYRPSGRQAAIVAEASLVVANGLGLEEGLADLLTTAAADGTPVLELAPLLDPRPLASATALDPHVWLDPIRMAEGVRIIGDQLAELDPTLTPGPAESYAESLERLDGRIREVLAPIPPERRLLVTYHDSLGYFAERYGFEVIGTLIPGGSTLAEASPARLAELVDLIDRTGVRILVVEAGTSSDLARAVAAETGGQLQVVELYIGSLGEPGTGAETYVTMMETNARRLADALGGRS